MNKEQVTTNQNYFWNFLKKEVRWSHLLLILLFQLLPTIYKTTRIFFLGTLPDENSYNIASQVLWLNILYEIIVESIVVPLFFVLNNIKKKENFKQTFTLISLLVFGLYLLFTIIIYFNIGNILDDFINRDLELFTQSQEYIQFEVWGMFLYSIFSYLFLIATILKQNKYLIVSLIVCILYTLLSCLFDLFFITDYSYSLKLSVKGIGINSILTNFICSLIFVVYLSIGQNRIWYFDFKNVTIDRKLMKKYLVLLIIASIEVTVRNVCFYFMVIEPINDLSNSGTYWVTNNFIWSWLLLPVTTLMIYIKETFLYTRTNNVKYQIYFYSLMMTIIIALWLAFIPINPIFIEKVMGVSDFKNVSQLVLILLPFYISFAYSSIIDSIFINQGKVNLYCIQSLIVNLTVYPIYFILWRMNIWKPTLNGICIMFGLGMLVHFIVDIPLFWWYLIMKENPLRWKNKNIF